MTRRTRRVLLVGAHVVLIALWVWPYILWQPARLNHDGFQQVQLEMTKAEVEQLFGGPPGVYYPSYRGAGAGGTLEAYQHPAGTVGKTWYDHKAEYSVYFDASGLVAAKHKRAGWYTTTHSFRHLYLNNFWTVLALGGLFALIFWHLISYCRQAIEHARPVDALEVSGFHTSCSTPPHPAP